MSLMANHFIYYRSSVDEMLTSKLVPFFIKSMYNVPVRMIIMMPNNVPSFKSDQHRHLYDEITTIKFDPTDPKFWNTKSISKYYYFTYSSVEMDKKHILIDHGKIVSTLPNKYNADIICANQNHNPPLMKSVSEKLSLHCGLPPLAEEDLVMYDFSLFYASTEAKKHIQPLLKKVIDSYPEYVDEHSCYAILSCIMIYLKEQYSLTVKSSDVSVVNITNSPFIEDFYSII